MLSYLFFFCHHPATTAFSTLSLHDALPIFDIFNHRIISLFYRAWEKNRFIVPHERGQTDPLMRHLMDLVRSEEHTSELQSRRELVCRLLLEKKKMLD